ncbi:hypothetical protein [Candidatus Nitrosotalea okcheonensis]|uniref:DUF5615 domain-containing protein n=1 Tax=Candidatus Nitrosotalea okcheonensis TaxID=1903276 RepID=A0A2H1FEZ8_9ARCH|nr:hypothetical protein [Candidatus Nitrosotalea okcheonensis]SMH71334.1 conserved protein of unknown function [Candidatus Nitrosotalea okcheonensis]
MKPRVIYRNRFIRSRTGTLVLVIPAPLAKEMGFKIHKKSRDYEKETVLNSRNEEAGLYIWLNSDYEIEMCDTSKPLQNTNGIMSTEGVHPHGKSCELTIPYSIRTTYQLLGIDLNKVDILKNEQGNIVVKPHLNSNTVSNTSGTKVLIDIMRDGLDDTLRKHDYDAHSVKKLCEEQSLNLRSDFSLMKYAEKHNMIIVTEDKDNVLGCRENNMDCVEFGQSDTLEYLLEELEKIMRKRNDDL